MPEAVLVANRGEIALRVLRACRDLGIATIGVYSEADRDAPWLAAADQAFLLGPAPAAESYLHVERILEAAVSGGATAIHPGYGFLAENADFARAVIAAGLTWIGPPPAAIDAMGDKLSARAVADAAGCPIVPGTGEPIEELDSVRAFTKAHGYPIALKAAFGGGGRGLKVVREEGELQSALDSAQREAIASFGRGEVYVERYLTRPRHIEIQILADAHGSCLFLGERDCSTQRRHQKLLEEAPAPGLDPKVRRAMGEAAVRVSQKVGYTGAGTCEFLYEDGDFYFLEMNTRLQVEHPVTELVTGIDLVTWQIRIANGEALTFGQEDVTIRGHAFEARINAEDVGAGFIPAPGRITNWQAPQGPGVRVDAGVATGWEIPRSYDSLIAKLVTYGADRDEARRRMLRALGEFVVEGAPTTIDFHTFAFAHDDVVTGNVSTISVEREWDLSSIAPAQVTPDAAPPAAPPSTLTVEVDGKRMTVSVFDPDGTLATARAPGAANPRKRSAAATTGNGSNGGDSADSELLTAPMQGTIVATAVAVGDTVAAGDLIIVLEAMKMENNIVAHRAGVVVALEVESGQVVAAGDVLARIEQADSDD